MRPATAHGRVGAAIRSGSLVRKPCEVCGTDKVDAHHEDYDRPLDVRWLCRKHHKQAHAAPRPSTQTVRAEITPGEWASLRSQAALERKTTQKLIGELLRECLAAREASA